MRRKKMIGVFVAVLMGAGAAGWLCREVIQAKYFVFRLNNAADHEVDAWVAQSAEWGTAVAPALLAQMIVDDTERCRRAGAALTRIQQGDAAAELSGLLQTRFESLSPAGQDWALQHIALQQTPNFESRRMIELALKSASPAIRRRAIHAATTSRCHELIAPLIDDADIEVRRAVVLALGPNRDWLSDDDLLPRLHDADREVQRMTRLALRSRGLTDGQVRFGKMLTDSNPISRLDLIALLRNDSELDLNEWLNRMSRDPSPAVRAAVARTAADLHIFQLIDRLNEMARSDSEAAVRQIVQFHLKQIQAAQFKAVP